MLLTVSFLQEESALRLRKTVVSRVCLFIKPIQETRRNFSRMRIGRFCGSGRGGVRSQRGMVPEGHGSGGGIVWVGVQSQGCGSGEGNGPRGMVERHYIEVQFCLHQTCQSDLCNCARFIVVKIIL